MAAIWFAVAAVNIAVTAHPHPLGSKGLLLGILALDALVALLVPGVMATLPPRPIHWSACVVFAVATLGVAFLLVLYIGELIASV
jgi:hypothetical protein